MQKFEKNREIIPEFQLFFCAFWSFWPIFDLFTVPLTKYHGQKSIQSHKLQEKNVLSFNIIHKIGPTGH